MTLLFAIMDHRTMLFAAMIYDSMTTNKSNRVDGIVSYLSNIFIMTKNAPFILISDRDGQHKFAFQKMAENKPN